MKFISLLLLSFSVFTLAARAAPVNDAPTQPGEQQSLQSQEDQVSDLTDQLERLGCSFHEVGQKESQKESQIELVWNKPIEFVSVEMLNRGLTLAKSTSETLGGFLTALDDKNNPFFATKVRLPILQAEKVATDGFIKVTEADLAYVETAESFPAIAGTDLERKIQVASTEIEAAKTSGIEITVGKNKANVQMGNLLAYLKNELRYTNDLNYLIGKQQRHIDDLLGLIAEVLGLTLDLKLKLSYGNDGVIYLFPESQTAKQFSERNRSLIATFSGLKFMRAELAKITLKQIQNFEIPKKN